MNSPFFSVILPVYNGERYLREAVESVIAQTYPDWELIIVDDASTDGTPKIVSDFLARDSRIRSIRNPQNINCGPSNNEGIKISRGQWITRIDADDHYRHDYLEILSSAVKGAGSGDFFLSSWVTIIDDKGSEILDMKLPDGKKVQRMLPIENFIYHPATSFPKSLWQKVGGYPEVQVESDDKVLWGKFFKAGARLIMIPRPLIQYRVHLANMSFDLESGGRIYDPSARRAVGRDAEWKISLLLKQALLKEARTEIRRLIQKDRRWTPKRLFYYELTFLPVFFVRFFMWEVRSRIRHILLKIKQKAK